MKNILKAAGLAAIASAPMIFWACTQNGASSSAGAGSPAAGFKVSAAGLNGAQNPNCSTVADNLISEVRQHLGQLNDISSPARRPPKCSPRPAGCSWRNLAACPLVQRTFAVQGNIFYVYRQDPDGGRVVVGATTIGAGGQSSQSPNVGPLSGHSNFAISCPDGRAFVVRDTAVVGTTNLSSGDNPNVTLAEDIPPFGSFNVMEVAPATCSTF